MRSLPRTGGSTLGGMERGAYAPAGVGGEIARGRSKRGRVTPVIAIERSEITQPTDSKQQASTRPNAPTDKQIHSLIAGALSDKSGLTPLKGFKLDLSANPGFRKVFFTARCDCGTAALLSVEVSREKVLAEVQQAVPQLTRRLESQAKSFYEMPCEVHKTMRIGPSANREHQSRG